MYEYVYQIYQLGINNFSRNKLFTEHALQDLSSLLNLRIIVYGQNRKFYEYKPFENCQQFYETIHLEKNEMSYKLLLPKSTSVNMFLNNFNIRKDSTNINLPYFICINEMYTLHLNVLPLEVIIEDLKKSTGLLVICFCLYINNTTLNDIIEKENLGFDLFKNFHNSIELCQHLDNVFNADNKIHFLLKKIETVL